MPRRATALWMLACSVMMPGRLAADGTPSFDTSALEFFETKVRPLLVEQCYQCHSSQAKKLKGGLLLESREALLKGGDSGPAIVPGQPDKSRLIEAVSYQHVELRMPPKGKLSASAIADLASWVKMGAPWPSEKGAGRPTAVKEEFDLQKRKQQHWAWRPIQPHAPPAVRDGTWPRNPIDAFILARLEAQGLKPASRAAKRTLIRRVYFDLAGLPPTPAEVEAFLADQSPNAFEVIVDRLLAAPHFGERWGRHWLDLVRYAESRGHEYDYVAPNAYQYRDYVIRALNADLPYNEFVTEHIAGDLLPTPRLHPTAGFNESILGTGFWFLGEWVHSPVDVRQDEADRFDNMIDVMMKTFQGLTIGCARCHDHKFDAISTKDYYALTGFLQSSSYRLARFDTMEQHRRIAEQLHQLRERSRPALQRAMAEAMRPIVDHVADYLMAAREVAGQMPEFFRETARLRRVDPEIVKRWVAYLNRAANNQQDLFHPWAKVAMDRETDGPKQFAASLKPLRDDRRERETRTDAGWKDVEVVIDYGRISTKDWMPDGAAFGLGPVKRGESRLGSDPHWPIVRIEDRGAAVFDRTWDRLKDAPGCEHDPGKVATLSRPGRTLQTPTFSLTTGKLFYLVRGLGHAYTSVHSHILINGPLHGQLVEPIKTGSEYQWVAHDLTPYRGQRVHVEFVPFPASDFAVAMVVQADKPPTPVEGSDRLLQEMLDQSNSLTSLASGYQRLLSDVIRRFAADELVGRKDGADHAALMNWVLDHAELFGARQEPANEQISAAAASFFAAQSNLVSQIRWESRLAMAMLDGNGQDENVFIRGSPKNLGEMVPRRFLEALVGTKRTATVHRSGRLELAKQMTDPALNPFLTRVMVNRVWHHLFGRSIVGSVDNFGVMGEPPTHPELLDFLATQFVEQGWSVKALIRSMVLSQTYAMSSQPDEKSDQADPQNLLCHRMRPRRLEGEAIRDAMLAVSGRLEPRLYGPSVPVYLTPFLDGRGRPQSGPLDGGGRRSLYLSVRRNFLSPLLLTFDAPIPFATVGRRTVSNVPAQALILLNDPFVHQEAENWARRILSLTGTPEERIARMYQSAFTRVPADDETAACVEFLKQQTSRYGDTMESLNPWTALAHVLFNVKEFIFVN
jgi:hypothetical protein